MQRWRSSIRCRSRRAVLSAPKGQAGRASARWYFCYFPLYFPSILPSLSPLFPSISPLFPLLFPSFVLHYALSYSNFPSFARCRWQSASTSSTTWRSPQRATVAGNTKFTIFNAKFLVFGTKSSCFQYKIHQRDDFGLEVCINIQSPTTP